MHDTSKRPDALGDAAVALTVELVRIDTVNPALVADAPGEAGAVALLSERLRAAGFEIQVVDPPGVPGRPSLLATATTGHGPWIVCNGHLDTVGVGAMADPWSGRIEGDPRTGRLHGRGACDMKGGVAAMVVAAEDAVASGSFRGRLTLALVADEEHASIGVEAVVAALRTAPDTGATWPDVCLITEPTWCDVIVSHRGFEVLEVVLRGRAAHSSQPERAVDAVRHLGRLLAEIEAHDHDLASRPAHPTAGHGSLQATVVHAGTAPFTIADRAAVTVERRTLPGEPAGVGADEVREILARLHAADPSVEATITPVLARDAWQASDDPMTHRLLDALERGLALAGRTDVVRRGAPYWMESAVWAAAGVPTLVCGPAGGGMHADDEWLNLAHLRAVTAALRSTLDELSGPPAG